MPSAVPGAQPAVPGVQAGALLLPPTPVMPPPAPGRLLLGRPLKLGASLVESPASPQPTPAPVARPRPRTPALARTQVGGVRRVSLGARCEPRGDGRWSEGTVIGAALRRG